jgi:hypothetical protein
MLGVSSCRLMPEVRVLDVAVLDELRDDVAHRVARDREADAEVALLAGVARSNLRVDADHLAARIEQRAAELPWFSAASVWIACSIVKLFGAVSGRSTALTIPAVTLRV